MAKLRRDVIAQARMYLDEVAPKSWTESELIRECNYGYQKLVSAVMNSYEDFYIDTATWDLKDSQQEYDVTTDNLPDDVYKVRRIELNYRISQSPTAFRKAIPTNITNIKGSLNTANNGNFSFPIYYVFGFEASLKIGLIPVPNQDSIGGGKLWYIPVVPDLAEQTSVVNIPYPDRYADAISLWAAGALLRKGQQEEAPASRYIADADALRDKMIEELEGRIDDEAKVISDSVGAYLDFTDPF